MKHCFSCYQTFGEDFDICPFCGAIWDDEPLEPIHLRPGTVLAERYLLGKAVGAGGFGIIYKAFDLKLETIVAVKEFFVTHIMTRAVGQQEVIINKKSSDEYVYRKERFLAEARTMAQFGNHKNIPNVFEFFEENGTAYIVMELLEGQPLNQMLQENGGKLDKDFALLIIREVGNALKSLHEKGIIHRDVAPDNIFICSGKELKIKLLDLGAAKLANNTDNVIDIILKPGYSPAEQYDNTKNIGPWTDIYALGATLYVMLTGVKPEESTNRKIEDTVPYPNELDASISENLSNSIMKAMAIEPHLRFKSVVDFVKGVDGEKKIVTIKQEKKRRATKRIIGISVAVIILLIAGFFVYRYLDSKMAVQVLKSADLSIWYCAENGADEETAIQAVVEDFTEVFPNIKIETQGFSKDEYEEKLKSAAEKQNLPTLFESTGVSDEILNNTIDLTNVLESDQAKTCLYLDQYSNYYKNEKKIPLGFEVPMAFVITKGKTSVEYTNLTFNSLNDFGEKTLIAFDDTHAELLSQNFDVNSEIEKEKFMNNKENDCAVLISSSMEINTVREKLTSYEKAYAYYDTDAPKAMFTYEWSIGGGSKNEVTAAERLLSWMLGNNYQNMLMVSRCSDGQLPINEECFLSKTEIKYYSALKDIYKKYQFIK